MKNKELFIKVSEKISEYHHLFNFKIDIYDDYVKFKKNREKEKLYDNYDGGIEINYLSPVRKKISKNHMPQLGEESHFLLTPGAYNFDSLNNIKSGYDKQNPASSSFLKSKGELKGK